ncbi:cryptochrome/photolyase family protein [Agrococcus sp. SGAir0287]|uniref:cryptochrome/photolyase family protein n=1 Tax=Agrococcus sp. SGAir0287 TaxID=2070347 RepID=UPI0010CCB348|nr:deoxyribodipyrimidine photo-lyase [Agrococcus sp. SGAir0287]QCR20592.1 deoxyribodipyrimidine photolyase [Agrococcus sp. SGAir0287]
MPRQILWFRRDLRLGDHPALGAAAAEGDVLPVFILDRSLLRAAGDVRVAALVDALANLRRATDGALVVRTGDPARILPSLAREVDAEAVHVSAEPFPYGRRRDGRVQEALEAKDVSWVETGSPYAVTPGRVRNGSGERYKVFTPFSKAWLEHGWRAPAGDPEGLRWCRQADSDDLPSAPSLDADIPTISEEAALERWHAFLDDDLDDYDHGRDRPADDSTSRMSAQLKWGTIHPRTMLADLERRARGRTGKRMTSLLRYRTELAWREFYADVLWHAPRSDWHDLTDALDGMQYDEPGEAFEAWKAGRTGYPMVDAGMRQLLAEGWMHNRVRMLTASFLVKDLHVWWPHGARHFLDHLVDGDMASNNHGWQWTAGTGTDAAPYFRVFNPVLQGQRFDPDGEYVRRWVPELRHIGGGAVHEPWKVDGAYDEGYPERILDHKEERAEALRRLEATKR